MMTIPAKIELEACCKRITSSVGPPPLTQEDNEEMDEETFERMGTTPIHYISSIAANKVKPDDIKRQQRTNRECHAVPFYRIGETSRAIQVGMRDLVDEVDGDEVPQLELPDELIKTATAEGLPILTLEFIETNLRFGTQVPRAVRMLVCQDVVDYADVFSWNQFDLGHITDVPHTVNRWDLSAAVQPLRRHLYNPMNDMIIKTKCWPLVELGIYKRAPPECIDRAQLTIVRKCMPEQRNDPAFLRVAHDYRDYNSRIYLDPEPCDNINDMMAWMGEGDTGSFFKMDADRGFNQIVMTREATLGSAFKMFNQLWVSERMLFGMKNGPATFKRNAVVMQGELLTLKKTKSYFDDILGKSKRLDYGELRSIWLRLLSAMRAHGWKCKLQKCEWGFEEIQTVGFVWSESGVGMAPKSIDAMKAMRMPTTLTELRAFLGLANQFRERIAGYALMVANLTSLTRVANTTKNQRLVVTPEAIMEFENVKTALASPPVLQQFRYDRKTIVYTDASVGTQDGSIAGGLEVVVVQEDESGLEYLCCCASSGLTAAQRNYHIVRLELLAFVYACGKFNEWLCCVPFIWRTDCRAHQYIDEARVSPNQTIARYVLALADYNYTVEWIPGVKMIADSLSRLVLLPAGQDAMCLPEICFGKYGKKIFAEKADGRVDKSPIMLYTPVSSMNFCEVVNMNIELEEGVYRERLIRHCRIPVSEDHIHVSGDIPVVADGEAIADGVCENPCENSFSLDGTVETPLFEIDLVAEPVFPTSSVSVTKTPVDTNIGEENTPASAFKRSLTGGEQTKFEALRYVKAYVLSGGKEGIPKEKSVAKAVRNLAGKIKVDNEDDGGKLWRTKRNGVRVEVLDTVIKIREALLMIHEGMGHRGMAPCYMAFQQRYWVPGASKIISAHVMACKVCQEFSKPNTLISPGYSMNPNDVFSHWSIDFAGSFPEDIQTGCKFVILAVDWLSRWVEGAACRDASPETAADFIYEYIVTRYGCPQSLQSDNGPHFVNPIIRCLCRILRVKHHLSTPYYPQSNGKIERVVGTIKTMLKRAVQDATNPGVAEDSDETNVVGVNTVVDAEVLDKIQEGEEMPELLVADGGMASDESRKIHWAPLLQLVLWAYRATPHTKTKLSPAMLALGTELRMPFDMTTTNAAPETDEEHKKMVAMRLSFLCDGIPGLREVREVKRIPRDMKKYVVGQKVWKRESKFDGKGFAPVFAPRWTGPFVVHAVWDKDVYKLRTDPSVTGRKVGYLKNPINGLRLKEYVEGELM